MNELVINNNSHESETMSSLDISELIGMEHKNVMRAIRNMEQSWAKISERNFALTSYNDAQGKPRPCYSLTKTECLFIATKFNDEARAKLVLRWEELEKKERQQFQVPSSFREALLLAAEQQAKIEEQQKLIEAKEEQVSVLTNKVAEMNEKVSYLDQILRSQKTMTVTQIAQDYGVSAISLNQTLESMRIQRKVNGQWILYAQYLSEGYVHSKPVEINGVIVRHNTEWTQKGRLFLYHKLKDAGILPLIEKL